MKNKGLSTWLYSSLGVVAMFLIIVIVNALASTLRTRIDLTAEHAYTLSNGTRSILAKLDTPIQIRFYCTRGDNRMPVFLKTTRSGWRICSANTVRHPRGRSRS